jgi:hypothetical protein
MTQPRLAIVVPYRDRQRNLRELLTALDTYEGLADIPFEIHVVSQADSRLFNRGALLNVGFLLASHCDYFCFHDVDLVPLEADYSFPAGPVHLGRHLSQFGNELPYESYFGGVNLFSKHDFQRINGFSNRYWGWGGEDDDLRLRCERAGMTPLTRQGRFHSLPHPGSSHGGTNPHHGRNCDRVQRMLRGELDSQSDGIRQVRYTLAAEETLGQDSGRRVSIHHVWLPGDDDVERDPAIPTYLRPVRMPGWHLGRDEYRYMLTESGETGIPVNETAALVWQTCDGIRTLDQVAGTLQQQYAAMSDTVYDDVVDVVQILRLRALMSLAAPHASQWLGAGLPVLEKTITVTANDRPHYLEKMLNSLRVNDIAGYQVVIALEPECQENLALCREFDHVSKTVIINPRRLGVRNNPYSVLDYVFNKGSRANVYLEDDIELSPDAIALADWYFDQAQSADCMGLRFFAKSEGKEDLSHVARTKVFSSLGFALTADQWRDRYEATWFDDAHQLDGVGWDFSINALLQRSEGVYMLQPAVARSVHIGRDGGTHCLPDFHDSTFGTVRIGRGRPREPYRLVRKPSPGRG